MAKEMKHVEDGVLNEKETLFNSLERFKYSKGLKHKEVNFDSSWYLTPLKSYDGDFSQMNQF